MTAATSRAARASPRKTNSTDDDQQRPFEQVLPHRVGGAVDDLRLVVERFDRQARGQRRADLGHARLHAVRDVLAVLALQHDDHAGHALAPAVARDGALAGHRANRHVRDIADVDRRALDGGDDDVPKVVHRLREPDAAHGVALGTVLDEPAAEGGVIVGQGLEHLPQGERIPLELPGIHQHLVLPRFAAPRVDLAHAAHRAQARADVPVVEGLLRHRVGRVALHQVLIDLAERGGHRPERRVQPVRDPAARLEHPLVDELPGEIDRHGILEDDAHDREPGLGDGAHLFGARHAHDRGFDRVRDALLDLGGREAGRLGHDHDLVVGQVGKGLDGQVPVGGDPGRDQGREAEQDEQALPQGGRDESFDGAHLNPPASSTSATRTSAGMRRRPRCARRRADRSAPRSRRPDPAPP